MTASAPMPKVCVPVLPLTSILTLAGSISSVLTIGTVWNQLPLLPGLRPMRSN